MRGDSITVGLVLVTAFILSAVVACRPKPHSIDSAIGTPESICSTDAASWRGILPGQSVKDDVLRILGEPAEKGYSNELKVDFFKYPPIVSIPGAKFGNLVAFHASGIVDWIDAWVSNSDGTFHTVGEFAARYGFTMDRVYVQGYGDVFGPPQVYVWSRCGIAATAVSPTDIPRSLDETLSIAPSKGQRGGEIEFSHPVHPRASVQPKPSTQQLVIRVFLFSPTNFESFQKLYENRIPYLMDERFYRLD